MPHRFFAEPSETATPIHLVDPSTLDASLTDIGGLAKAWVDAHGYGAAAGTVLLIPGSDGAPAHVLFGLGEADDPARTGMLMGALSAGLPDGLYRFAVEPEDGTMASIAWGLGAYEFDAYRPRRAKVPVLTWPVSADRADVLRVLSGAYLARDLINRPSNDMGPEQLADVASELAARNGAACRVIVGEDLLAENFPMIHAVGRASDRVPRLIDISWAGEAADADSPKVTLVGKGVCFDTGGLDLKPSSAMLLMKKDMGGSAAVLGLASMLMDANLPINLRVLVPAVENSVSGNAFRPGDVLQSRKGLTVEIGNTDAEGRLVLADALTLAEEDKPDLLIDMATLTGAARVALGPDLPPYYTRDDALAAAFEAHAEIQSDPVWRMPLWPAYDKLLSSKIADVNHISSGAFAGSITAALFLGRFVDKATPWMHFDIFGWVPSRQPGRPEGGDAQAIRALYDLIRTRFASRD